MTTMKYQYGLLGKMMHFPWKYYWKHGRMVRYTAYALIPSYYLFFKIHQLVNSPANVKMWKEKREHRNHDVFAPVTEDKHH